MQADHKEFHQWTIDSLKKELPDIIVRLKNGQVIRGKLSGREFARITVYSLLLSSGDLIPYYNMEFAWESLVNCLNNQGFVKFQ